MKVSVIIPNRNDVSLCAITIRTVIECLEDYDYEIIVADNSGHDIFDLFQSGKIVSKKWKNLKYIHQEFPCLFSAFDNAAEIANGKYIIRIDSDCICGNNMIQKMVEFMDRNEDRNIAFGHAPINFFTQHRSAMQHYQSFSFGRKMCRWGGKCKEEQPIPYKGMPWIIRKDRYFDIGAFGSLAKHRLTPFGDPYLGLKSWILGYENWAIICNPAIHLGTMEAFKPYDRFNKKSGIGQGNSYLTACVTAYVLNGMEDLGDWAAKFIRIGKCDPQIEDKVKEYAKNNLDAIIEIGGEERKWIEKKQKYTLNDLANKQPWNKKQSKAFTIGLSEWDKNAALWERISGNLQLSIKKDDWEYLFDIIKKYDVKNILEFGAGLSTLMFNSCGVNVKTYETQNRIIDAIKTMLPNADINYWENHEDIDGTYDLCFVDGRRPRQLQCDIAKKTSRIVVLHDYTENYVNPMIKRKLSAWSSIGEHTERTIAFLKPSKRLSVIIANRNDLEMLSITARSCMEEFFEIDDACEIVICDNSNKDYFDQINKFINPQYMRDGTIKIERQDFPCIFTARQTAIEKAEGEYIFMLDSHVLLGNNILKDVLEYATTNEIKTGIIHPPINHLNRSERTARHEQKENGSKYYAKPNKMAWKGMPWLCNREWFLNAFNGYGFFSKHQLAWGGGDIYLGVKNQLLGYGAYAVPTRPAWHIGPFGCDRKYYQYRRYGNSGNGSMWFGLIVASYVFGCNEFDNPITRFRWWYLEKYNTAELWEKAKRLGDDERQWMQNRQIMSVEDLLKNKPWLKG